MDLLCCLDDNYIQHTSVMLTSFFINNPSINHRVFIITLGINNYNKTLLENLVSKYDSSISIYLVDENVLKDFPLKESDYVSLAAYLRLFCSKLLPNDIDKVLYLDGDVVVRKSLDNLWALDVDGFAVAAIDETIKENCLRHQYDFSKGYFNSGIMIINLNYWRENNVSEKAIEYMNKYPQRIKSWDQDALNGILHNGLWKRIELKYNLTTLFLYKKFMTNDNFSKIYASEYKEAVQNPSIVHFTGPDKPWMCTVTDHPFKDEYFKYLNILGIRNNEYRLDINTIIKKYLKKGMLKVGIKESYYIR